MARINNISGYLLLLSCAVLPFSYKLSTFLIVSFSIIQILANYKLVNSPKKIDFLELIELPWFILMFPLIGIIFTNYKTEAIQQIVKYLPYLILSLTYFFVDKKIKQQLRKSIIAGLIIGVTLVLLYLFTITIYKYLGSNDSFLKIFSYRYTYNNFLKPLDSHPTYLGLLVIISNYFLFRSKKSIQARGVILFINTLGLLFIMSKVIIIIFLAQIIEVFFKLKNKRVKISIALIIISLGIVASFLSKNFYKDFYFLQRFSKELVWDLNSDNSNNSVNGRVNDDSRLARWSAITDKIKDSLILGYGSGSEKQVLKKTYKENSLYVSLKREYNTHSQYLFFGLEYGIIGILLFVYFLISNLYGAFKRNDFFIFHFVFWIIIICCFENYFNRTMGVLLISITLTFMRIGSEKNNVDI